MNSKEKEHLRQLVADCIIFCDRNGKILERDDSPVHAHLTMKYEENGFKIFFDVFVSGMTNGSCRVTVMQDDETVFDARGNYMTGPFNVEAKKYLPGPWEKKIEKMESRLW